MKKIFILMFFFLFIIFVFIYVEFKGGFVDIGFYYFDWILDIMEKISKKFYKDDFGYLELEGGVNFSWGEMYGFFDWENFYNGCYVKSGSEQCYIFKNINCIYLGDIGLNFYFYVYGMYGLFYCVNFYDDMFFYGLGYNFIGNGYWFKFFFVKCYIDQIYYIGDNGYVLGWVVGYSFLLGSEKFSVMNWNEYEFDCDVFYVVGNGGKDGINGVVVLWWNVIFYLIVGV